jgi:L-ascorbate metabolism protein UlaG (beta-lactamase superfamily)
MRSYVNLPKADIILVIHEHLDHSDVEAIRDINTVVIMNGEACAKMHCIIVIKSGESKHVNASLRMMDVPADNTSAR